MPEIVKDSDIWDALTWMSIKDSTPSADNKSAGYNRNYRAHDFAYLLPKVSRSVEGRKEIREHYLGVKFNVKGRPRNLYREWPKIALFSPWMYSWLHKWGLAEKVYAEVEYKEMVVPGALAIKIISHNDTGWGLYIPDKELKKPYLDSDRYNKDVTRDAVILLQYEGEIAAKPK